MIRMIFYDKRGCRVSGEELGETEGHWIVSFVGSKAEVAEVYDYVLTKRSFMEKIIRILSVILRKASNFL